MSMPGSPAPSSHYPSSGGRTSDSSSHSRAIPLNLDHHEVRRSEAKANGSRLHSKQGHPSVTCPTEGVPLAPWVIATPQAGCSRVAPAGSPPGLWGISYLLYSFIPVWSLLWQLMGISPAWLRICTRLSTGWLLLAGLPTALVVEASCYCLGGSVGMLDLLLLFVQGNMFLYSGFSVFVWGGCSPTRAFCVVIMFLQVSFVLVSLERKFPLVHGRIACSGEVVP
ncbi:hypothetical protein NC652_034961 [Populus alba x Populus x berolinensis]|nr:hypothetical protein NC652_034961 [Populus alba x Populus x berolinensis]